MTFCLTRAVNNGLERSFVSFPRRVLLLILLHRQAPCLIGRKLLCFLLRPIKAIEWLRPLRIFSNDLISLILIAVLLAGSYKPHKHPAPCLTRTTTSMMYATNITLNTVVVPTNEFLLSFGHSQPCLYCSGLVRLYTSGLEDECKPTSISWYTKESNALKIAGSHI